MSYKIYHLTSGNKEVLRDIGFSQIPFCIFIPDGKTFEDVTNAEYIKMLNQWHFLFFVNAKTRFSCGDWCFSLKDTQYDNIEKFRNHKRKLLGFSSNNSLQGIKLKIDILGRYICQLIIEECKQQLVSYHYEIWFLLKNIGLILDITKKIAVLL